MAYNVILGRPWIHNMDVMPSTLHQVIKFPSKWGIQQIRGDQQTSRSINSVIQPSQKDTNASQKDAGASEKDAVNQISTEISKQTDVDSRLDVIQEPEENENIKTTIEELEVVPLFEQLPDRRIHIRARLNPDRRGIEVNPAQIKAIEEIPDILTRKKGVQRLTGRIAALGRFISISSEKRVKFFSVLKKQNQFGWTEECRQALKDLKAYLTNPPLLSKPRNGERLFVYLAVAEVVVSAVLVRKDKDFNAKIIPEVEKELQNFTRANPGTWTLFTDGSSNVKGAGLNIVLIPPSGLELARELSIEQIMIKSDSQLVVNQMEENAEADTLANPASVVEVTSEENAIYGIVHECKKESQVLQRKAAHYCLIQDNLYRKIFGGPLARTTTKTATRETPFSLVYGSEALIPVEVGEPSTRFTLAMEESNDEELRTNLNLLEQRRDAALIWVAAQK
nr:uncharacterized protein LOC117278214 [Nicotiana tomentosiformis]